MSKVPLECPKCNHLTEFSEKEWEKHWHGVEYKCPKCAEILMQGDKVLQAMGKANGAINDYDWFKTLIQIVLWWVAGSFIVFLILSSF